MLKRALLASVALAALTAPAYAEPISLITAGITALVEAAAGLAALEGALTIAGLTASQIAGGAVLAGGLAYSLLSGQPQRANLDPGAAKSTFQSAEMGLQHCIGTVHVGGLQVYGNTKDYRTYRLIGHCVEPIDTIGEYYLGGRFVVREDNGEVSTPPYANAGGSWVYINTKSQEDVTSAWSQLTSALPDLWTSDHKCQGISQTLVEHISPGTGDPRYLKLRSSGVPEVSIKARFGSFYDPRDGQYRWTDNGIILAMYVYLTFPDASLDDFDMSYQAAEADKADTLVSTRTGTEKRSRISGKWTETEGTRSDILEQVLRSAGAEQVNLPNGKIGFRLIDENRPATLHFPKEYIIDHTIKAGPDGVERQNKCQLKFYSREALFTMADIDLVNDRTISAPVPLSWSRSQREINEVGERVYPEELPMCFSAAQAQRIARRRFTYARGDRFTATLNWAGVSILLGENGSHKTVSFEIEYLDEPLVVEIGPPEIDDTSRTVRVTGVVQPYLEPWNPAVHEAMPPDQLPEPEYSTSVAQPSAATFANYVIYPDATREVRAFYPSVSGSVEAVCKIDGAVSWSSMTEVAAQNFAYVAVGAAPAAGIEFRHRVFVGDDGSVWSTTYSGSLAVSNAAPAVPTLMIDGGSAVGVIAPTSQNVAYISVKPPSGSAVNHKARPGQSIEPLTIPTGYEVRAHSSNGTASAVVVAP